MKPIVSGQFMGSVVTCIPSHLVSLVLEGVVYLWLLSAALQV